MGKKIKELVCASPDGSIEVWKKDKMRVLGGGIVLMWYIIYKESLEKDPSFSTISYQVCTSNFRPEFWGREVLGEL